MVGGGGSVLRLASDYRIFTMALYASWVCHPWALIYMHIQESCWHEYKTSRRMLKELWCELWWHRFLTCDAWWLSAILFNLLPFPAEINRYIMDKRFVKKDNMLSKRNQLINSQSHQESRIVQTDFDFRYSSSLIMIRSRRSHLGP